MSAPIPNITFSLQDLNRQEYQFDRYSLMAEKNIYSLLAGRHASKMRGRGLDFEEVRKYVPGDDIRNIDWKVTARTRTTYSKVFNEEKERPNFALVDMSASMMFGSTQFTKAYIAGIVTALAGFKVIKRGDRFGGLIFNDQSYDQIQPKRSRKNLQHFFNHLVSYNEQLLSTQKLTQDTRLNEMLYKTSTSLGHDYLVVVVSDFLRVDDQTLKHLINISKHNDVICAQIVDPMEIQLPEAKMLLSDGDRQMLWSRKSMANQKFSESAKERLQNFKQKVQRFGMVYLTFNTEEEVAVQMKNIIAKARRR